MALAGGIGSWVSAAAPEAWLELRELEIRGNISPSPPIPPKARAFVRGKPILKLSVLFRYGPIRNKAANGWRRSRPQWRKALFHFS